MFQRYPATLVLPSPDETTRLAAEIAPLLRPGDTLLLEGPIGAGKTHFARALIGALQAAIGKAEDIPSPTFTLVQVYEGPACDIWHADLYRLNDIMEVAELGLEDAFLDSICLVEWPDRLGALTPEGALRIEFLLDPDPHTRILTFNADSPRWTGLLEVLSRHAGQPATTARPDV